MKKFLKGGWIIFVILVKLIVAVSIILGGARYIETLFETSIVLGFVVLFVFMWFLGTVLYLAVTKEQ